MVRFSSDVDLLKWEPVVFRELAPASQTLCRGEDGVLSGTAFTAAGVSFEAAGVAAGNVIVLEDGNELDGCFEVASVDSPTQLTVSVVRESAADAPVAPPGGTTAGYRISTFDPQAEEVAYSLLQYFGLREEGEGAGRIVSVRALRQAAAFAVLMAVFAAGACGAGDPSGYWQKSVRYQKLFEAARARARVELDVDGVAGVDEVRLGGSVRLRRA